MRPGTGRRVGKAVGLCIVLGTAFAGADEAWHLGEHLDRALLYSDRVALEMTLSGSRYNGVFGELVMPSIAIAPDGTVRPAMRGMAVDGTVRPHQFLLSGGSAGRPAWMEFVIHGGSGLHVAYGLCDGAKDAGNPGASVRLEVHAGGRVLEEAWRITENTWQERTFAWPGSEPALVRISSRRIASGHTHWTALAVSGEGRIGTREEARARSPVSADLALPADRLDSLPPFPGRVEARPGYDILFYRDRPFLSYAAKGHGVCEHALQAEAGINTYYVEGMGFRGHWPEGAETVAVPVSSPIRLGIWLSRRHDMPFKAAMSMAHGTPFLPEWLVERENLGFEGHRMRRGGPTHASIFKEGTRRWYKAGLRGWVEPFREQPSLFVFSQEDVPEQLDDFSDEAAGRWRAWLETRFSGDFQAFADYVGGVEEAASFAEVPQVPGYDAVPWAGAPMRAAWLKFLWVQETFADFLADVFAHTREMAPGIPLTQRYVYSPAGIYLSRRVGSDYNYTAGHLSTEDWPNAYGIGNKPWTGMLAHAGTLPFPRGCSIGKAYDRDLRRGPMTEAEWRLHAYLGLANGMSGFEYSPFLAAWGPRWAPAALVTEDLELNEQGRLSAQVMGELLELTDHLGYYERHEDVAVFHDAAFNASGLGGRIWSQSKIGIYTLIRETGFHPDVLTAWDMTAENLAGRKVLVLAGTTSLAPEIQEAVRAYVAGGGTLVAVYTATGRGFPGANSYAHDQPLRESTETHSFGGGGDAVHLGDVLGIRAGGGNARRAAIEIPDLGRISLASYNALVDEERKTVEEACAAQLEPVPEARVLATFDDGSPAAIEHAFGAGRALTIAVDIGLIANNVTIDPLYAIWSELLLEQGCRRAVDTGNWRVFGGAWRNDAGQRVVFLVNLDPERPQEARLPDGQFERLDAGASRAVVFGPQGQRWVGPDSRP